MGLMRRQQPFFSPLGCSAALLLIAGVVAAVLITGGDLMIPGPLSAQSQPDSGVKATGAFASHAAFESDCGQCHAPFQGIEAARCERCHTTVADERARGIGLHGTPQVTNVARCQACHPEHQGRDYKLLAAARQTFNHQNLKFSLALHVRDYAQQPLARQCQTCHVASTYAVSTEACTACHGAHDQAFMSDHSAAFGADCLACHDGVDKMKGFNHSQTKFPLTDRHEQAACAACHKPAVAVADTPTECVGCHAEPQVHAGMFGAGCATCHTPAAWAPAKVNNAVFDHTRTGFALTSHGKDFDGTAFPCTKCHPGAVRLVAAGASTFDQQVCVACHTRADSQFMTDHTQKYGSDCVSCHDGAGNMVNFDHKSFFVLDGQHAALKCDQCHANRQFKGTPKQCAGCHAEPKVHAGLFGADCAACHTSGAWTPARLTRHTFPLDHGGQGQVPCGTCHPDTYPAYTCYGCHDHVQTEIINSHAEKNIQGDQLSNCAACHASGRSN